MKLEILVGMIASGKSTYARRRAREGAMVVSHDDLTAMLHAEYRYEEGHRQLYRAIEEDLVRRLLDSGLDVIVDRTHLTAESRARWVAFARKFIRRPVILAVATGIVTPETHALRRSVADHRGRAFDDWLRVAKHHAGQAEAEPLTDQEGFDAIIRISPEIPSDHHPTRLDWESVP